MTKIWTLMGGVALSGLLIASPALAQTSLALQVDAAPNNVALAEALVAAFTAENPDITIDVEVRPSGTEGDNLIRTNLSTGTQTDIFVYNPGSLFQALNPQATIVDLSDEPWQANVQTSFKQTVTAPDGTVRGAPFGVAIGGGMLYHIPTYEELGLEVPKTWEQFLANSQAILDAGKAPVIQTYGAAWSSQMLVLADYYNVQSKEPNFADRYTSGEATFGNDPAARRSFEKVAELHDAGYFNEDFGSATYEDGLMRVAVGDGVHYPMLTNAISSIAETNPDELEDVGFFPIPGDDAAQFGLTVWMPQGLFIAQNSPNIDAAKQFLAFAASPAGCEAIAATGNAIGPYLVNGCELPGDVPRAVKDMLPFFGEGGQNAPVLELLSPIKGPNLPQILVEVGSGMRTAADGAALYDEDVRKQAQQLGLPGW